MKKCYCSNCSKDFPYFKQFRNNFIIDPLGSTYQQDKFHKHTVGSTQYPVVSIFNDPSTKQYEDYLINASHWGVYIMDDKGRESIVLFAGKPTGITYINGQPELQTDSIIIVQSSESSKLHLYPISSTNFSTGNCEDCGISIITNTHTI